jgi:hypothetical protein
MKTHAHFAGRILCGQANAKSVPLEAWIALPEKQRCKRCRKNQVANYGLPQPKFGTEIRRQQ